MRPNAAADDAVTKLLSRPVELIESLADRVIKITDDGVVDHQYGDTELLARHTEELPVAVGA